MLSLEDIKKRYSIFNVRASAELYLSTIDALRLVQECDENNLAIVGMEGFTLRNGFLYPNSDMIADFTSVKNYELG